MYVPHDLWGAGEICYVGGGLGVFVSELRIFGVEERLFVLTNGGWE